MTMWYHTILVEFVIGPAAVVITFTATVSEKCYSSHQVTGSTSICTQSVLKLHLCFVYEMATTSVPLILIFTDTSDNRVLSVCTQLILIVIPL